MFKKFSRNLFDKELVDTPTSAFHDLASRPPNPFSTDLMNALEPHAFEVAEEGAKQEEPETIIAAGVAIKGTMSFQKLIRIDGNFEGELLSSGKLIIGPTGSVKANINLEEAFISGKITGDITVKTRLVLRGRAEVRGDITAPLISVDEGVSIVGILNIVQENPSGPTEDDPYSDPDN
jgi:cytoskeletal protein CcmA (bactofilin family)